VLLLLLLLGEDLLNKAECSLQGLRRAGSADGSMNKASRAMQAHAQRAVYDCS
jgi:hypothetical protein